jgi:hypothetical protein
LDKLPLSFITQALALPIQELHMVPGKKFTAAWFLAVEGKYHAVGKRLIKQLDEEADTGWSSDCDGDYSHRHTHSLLDVLRTSEIRQENVEAHPPLSLAPSI